MAEKIFLSEFREKVTNYMRPLQDYCETFDIDLFSDKFLESPFNKTLRNNTKIKQAMIDFFLPLKEELLSYQYDYFSMKSARHIAEKIDSDTVRVVAYLERKKHSFKTDEIIDLTEVEDVSTETKVKNISSFKILKDFQLKDRQLLLKRKTNQRINNTAKNIK